MKDTVRKKYRSLENLFSSEVNRGAIERSTPFNEWAVGRVLLNVEETRQLRKGMKRSAKRLVRGVAEELLVHNQRLKPALTVEKDSTALVVVLHLPR